MSAIEKNIVAQAKRFGEPIPDRIKNKPRLRYELAFFLDAFYELDTDRNMSVSFGPIPWSSLNNYAVAHEITGEDYHDFMYLVRAVDSAYIKHMREKTQHGDAS